MSGPALLDINLLIALFDPDHIHHEPAHDWFADHHRHGWATCPVTENGFVRILANPAYGSAMPRAAELVSRLYRFCRSPNHQFWPDDISLRDEARFHRRVVGGHRQLTDIYLLGLATHRKGRLATFDRTIPVDTVVGASGATLAVVEPV